MVKVRSEGRPLRRPRHVSAWQGNNLVVVIVDEAATAQGSDDGVDAQSIEALFSARRGPGLLEIWVRLDE